MLASGQSPILRLEQIHPFEVLQKTHVSFKRLKNKKI